jgi:hypothetical protein
MKKKFRITYLDYFSNEKQKIISAICKEMAEIIFRNFHLFRKIISVEEV